MSWMTITCQCGHTDDIDCFCSTTIFGPLPPNNFQCPVCGIAWECRMHGLQVIGYGSGSSVIPEKITCDQIESRS